MSQPSTYNTASQEDHTVIPTVEWAIEKHRQHLAAGSRSDNTVEDAARLLRWAHDHLPVGLWSPHGEVAAAEELVAFLANSEWSPQTKSTYRQHLRRFYQWAHDQEIIDWDPSAKLPSVRVPPGMPHPASNEQARIATTRLPDPFLLAGRLAAYMGLRCIEIAAAQRDDFTEQVTTVRGKGGRVDVVPTHQRVWELVADLPPGYVVTRRRGWPVTAAWVSDAGRAALRRAGADITMHELRHWFGTMLLRTTGNMEHVRRLMRHRSMDTTARYTLVELDELHAAVAGLPDLGQ